MINWLAALSAGLSAADFGGSPAMAQTLSAEAHVRPLTPNRCRRIPHLPRCAQRERNHCWDHGRSRGCRLNAPLQAWQPRIANLPSWIGSHPRRAPLARDAAIGTDRPESTEKRKCRAAGHPPFLAGRLPAHQPNTPGPEIAIFTMWSDCLAGGDDSSIRSSEHGRCSEHYPICRWRRSFRAFQTLCA